MLLRGLTVLIEALRYGSVFFTNFTCCLKWLLIKNIKLYAYLWIFLVLLIKDHTKARLQTTIGVFIIQ